MREAWGPLPTLYQVKSGETLYSIAWKYGKDYRDIARLNKIAPPFKIKAGQRLRLSKMVNTQTQKNKSNALKKPAYSGISAINDKSELKTSSIKIWLWPVKGRVIASFASQGGMNKGIDIAALPGSLVKASAPGKVVYSGSGLRGYGELIIIKHNDEFLSAYAHNKKLLVREGQMVTAGQAVALVGSSEAKRVLLHFEIRRAGKPVDPMKYLSKSN